MYIEVLKKFIAYFGSKRKIELGLFFLMSLIAGLLEFLGVALIYPFIMMIIRSDNTEYLAYFPMFAGCSISAAALIFGVCALLLFVIKDLYMIMFLYVQCKFLQKWTHSINNMFVNYFLYAPYKNNLKISASEKIYIITVLSTKATNGFFMRIMTLATNLIIVALILGLILWKFPLAGFVSLGFITICILLQNLFFKRKVRLLSDDLEIYAKEMNNLNWVTVNNIKDIKIFCCERIFYENYDRCGSIFRDKEAMEVFYAGIPPYLVETIIVLTLLILGAIITVQNLHQSSMLVASFALIVASVFRIAPALNRIQSSILNLPAGLKFVNELISFYEKLELADFCGKYSERIPVMTFKNKIFLHNICFSYEDGKQVLKNISFNINKRDFVGIIGLSGAGKSTLADVLTCLLPPDSGEIVVDNIKINKENAASFRKNIGYVQQDLNVLERSFRENVAWGIPPELIDDELVKYLLNQVQLDELVKKYDDGIYALPFIGENGLSRGQKQRLAIARALYRNPEILIFDEATSALDVKTERSITDMLLNVCKAKTIIAIAHRLSTLKSCNKLIYLKDGRLIDTGTFADLSLKYSEFNELVRLSSLDI